jgi:membrane fusion protein (multidrug efflux system)
LNGRPSRLFAIATALLGCSLFLPGCSRQDTAPRRFNTQAEVIVDVRVIKPQPFRETLFATGNLLANESVRLRTERAGLVKEVRFQEGQPVKAGDVLLLIDDSELQAQRSGAQARLQLARAVDERDKALFDNKMISAAEYEQSRANLKVIEAELELIGAQLEKTRVVAPFDGLTGLRLVSPGAYLPVGTTVASLQDVASVKLDFTLPERYQPMLKTGQKILFHVTGRTNSFTATITAIEPAIDVETRSLQLRALAPNPERLLLPGAFAEVEIALDEVPEAILIPPIALVPGLKQQTVFLHRNGVVEERKVQVGLRTAHALQVLSGLKPGDELITSGILQLRAGMKVRVKGAQAPATQPPAPGDGGGR